MNSSDHIGDSIIPRTSSQNTQLVNIEELSVPKLFIDELLRISELWCQGDFDLEKIRLLTQSAARKLDKLNQDCAAGKLDIFDHTLTADLEIIEETIAASQETANSAPDEPQISTKVLTEDQQQAFNALQEFVYSDEKYFRLSGFAGTGKSYTIALFFRWLKVNEFSFVAGAPTNKAAKNLIDLGKEHGLKLDTYTVAQLLGQQPVLNNETGEEDFVSELDSLLPKYSIAGIDEYSMISKGNFQDIQRSVQGHTTKVIMIGDWAQLPPVGEEEPIVAIHPDIKCSANLTTIVRYEGAIARVAEKIRSDPQYNKRLYPFKTTTDGTIQQLPRQVWLDTAAEYFLSESYLKNPNYVRFLVWRNKTAGILNTYVREKLWGADADPYVIGDRLIAQYPVFRFDATKPKGKEWSIIMGNSEECEIDDQPILVKFDFYGWLCWKIPVITENHQRLTLQILTEESELERKQLLSKLKDQRNWREYYDILKRFDRMQFCYATTTHKAQGSGINHVFLDSRDMYHCPYKQKMLYTALTRTREAAYIPGR